MPDSCMFTKNVCKLLQLFLIKCKRQSPEAVSLSTAPPHSQGERGATHAPQGRPQPLCDAPTPCYEPATQKKACLSLCHLHYDHFFFNGVCDQLCQRDCAFHYPCLRGLKQAGWPRITSSATALRLAAIKMDISRSPWFANS